MRALKYVDDKPQNAVASMMSDIHKHPETETHIGVMLGLHLMKAGTIYDSNEVRKWIEGFN